jgi:hypothetical protein
VIEDELRDLLTTRAGSVRDNPARLRSVHARISAIRRRRTAGAALVLVLLALAGVLLTRLPGRPETLPAGVPAGPYFGDDGTSRTVPGYRGSGYFTFGGDAVWSYNVPFPMLPVAIAVGCERRGDLTLRGLGDDRRISCRVPVGDHYEGALLLPARFGGVLSKASVPTDVHVQPDSPGRWQVGVLQPLFPDRLTAADLSGQLSGYEPGRIDLVVPSYFQQNRTLTFFAECVRGVQLEIRISGRPAGTLNCVDRNLDDDGLVEFQIRDPDATRLGLRPLQHFLVDVRQVAGAPKQWAIISVA